MLHHYKIVSLILLSMPEQGQDNRNS